MATKYGFIPCLVDILGYFLAIYLLLWLCMKCMEHYDNIEERHEQERDLHHANEQLREANEQLQDQVDFLQEQLADMDVLERENQQLLKYCKRMQLLIMLLFFFIFHILLYFLSEEYKSEFLKFIHKFVGEF